MYEETKKIKVEMMTVKNRCELKNYDTILWDLDGTLLYTLEDLTDAVNAALTEFNLPMRSLDEVKDFVGDGIRRLMERAVPDGGDNPRFAEIFAFFRRYYGENCNRKTKPFAGISELLHRLQREGWRQAVVSNKIDSAVRDLVRLYFADTIGAAVGDNTERRKKPAPDNLLFACGQLGSRPERAVFIGDSNVDVMTAKNAALPMIIVDWGYRSRERLVADGAENIVSTPDELYEVLCSLNK